MSKKKDGLARPGDFSFPKVGEFLATYCRNGGTPELMQRAIDDPVFMERLMAAWTGANDSTMYPCRIHVPDLVPEWAVEIVEDVEPRENLRVSDLTFEAFLEEGEGCTSGEEMRKRAKDRGADLGLSDVPAILTQQADILEEVRQGYIVLPGTVLRSRDGYLHVPYLHWRGGEWVLDFYWLDSDWHRNVRFALSK